MDCIAVFKLIDLASCVLKYLIYCLFYLFSEILILDTVFLKSLKVPLGLLFIFLFYSQYSCFTLNP